ncbi:MAG: hypothetical protein ACOYVI_06300 [Bacillota bacterium]
MPDCPGRADDSLQVPAARRPPGSRLILAEPAAGTAGSPARRGPVSTPSGTMAVFCTVVSSLFQDIPRSFPAAISLVEI